MLRALEYFFSDRLNLSLDFIIEEKTDKMSRFMSASKALKEFFTLENQA